MSERVRIDWFVPSNVWSSFRAYVESEFGGIEGYLGREAERAMMEYTDTDRYDVVENMVDRLVRAAGRTPETSSKEKNSQIDRSDTTRVTARVESSVKDGFRDFAADEDDSYGVVFARAIDAYLHGGRSGRLERKLERVVDDAESLLAEVSGSNDKGLGTVERKTIAVCRELPDEFTDDELVDTVVEVAGVDSGPSIEKYRKRVVDRLEYEPHPYNPKVWVPEDVAEDLSEDAVPRECRVPVDLLERDDRERRVKLEVGRRAAQNPTGRARVSTTDVREDVFGGATSTSSTHDIVKAVAREEGFSLDDQGSKTYLRVDLTEIVEWEPGLWEEIAEYRDATSKESSTKSDFDAEAPEESVSVDETEVVDHEVENEADDMFSQLEQASREVPIATDGGRVE